MGYTSENIIEFIKEGDVKFIRLAFVDVFGKQKNISIMPNELEHAFKSGIALDASSIRGFGGEIKSDLFLVPDPNTISILPWRPSQGRVVRMFCDIKYPDGTPFACDTRNILKEAIKYANESGITFSFGSELEFYLFKTDEDGNSTKIPYDNASYMDIYPDDKGENIRREICLTLTEMDILPEGSHHEDGPGQNEIHFRYAEALKAADDAITFESVVRTIASRNGLCADFSPKPLKDEAGNGFHINMSLKDNVGTNKKELRDYAIAGILKHIKEMTLFFNSTVESYERLGQMRAPRYIAWSSENRSQLIRIPAAGEEEYERAEIRSADPLANPYLAFALIIYASIDGIKNKYKLQEATNDNLFTASSDVLSKLDKLPANLEEAIMLVKNSKFIKDILPTQVIETYIKK
ncbi:MAG: glutamine synthetase family protein [Anaeroplasmataceae bacterium]